MNVLRRESRAVDFSQRVYRKLLAAYPRAYRAEFGEPMAQLFRDQCRDAWQWKRGWGLLWLWLRVLPDLARTAVWERLTNRGERKYMFRKMFSGVRSPGAYAGLFIAVATTVFVLVTLSATIFTFILPETYTSRARILIENDGFSAPKVYDSQAIQAELAMMQSERILDGVIERLDLNTVWRAKYNAPAKLRNADSRALLKAMIKVTPVRDTRVVEVAAYSVDPQEAASIANAIVEEFQAYRRQQSDKLTVPAVEYQKLTEQLKNELADKTSDPKVVDAKITETIARAAKLYEIANAKITVPKVEIVESAQPGFLPVRPNKPLNIFLGGVIGAFAGVVIASLLVMTLIRWNRKAPATV